MIHELSDIREEIIKIYLQEHVMRLKTSGEKLYGELFPYMKHVHLMKNYIIQNWKNNQNDIIRTFASQYNNHYIENNFFFKNMSINESFVSTISFMLYH